MIQGEFKTCSYLINKLLYTLCSYSHTPSKTKLDCVCELLSIIYNTGEKWEVKFWDSMH